MSQDVLNMWFNKTASAGTSITSSVLDHGVDASSGFGGRGPGPSRGIFLEITINTFFDLATTAPTFVLSQSATVGMGSPTVLGTYVAAGASGNWPEQTVVIVALPTITQQFTRIVCSWTTTDATAIVSAGMTKSPQASFDGHS